jgi:hypothetical protein
MFKFRRSNWSIAGNSGVTATVGTPIARIQVGGSYLRLPVRNKESSETSMLQGIGVGGSLSISPEIPWTDFFNISGSPDFYPSNGIGPIFRKAGQPDKPYKLDKLTGDLLVLAANGATNFHGVSLCLGLWLKGNLGNCLNDITGCDLRMTVAGAVLTITPAGFPPSILMKTYAVGVFWGLVNTTDVLSAGGSAFQYRLSNAS